jgi:hypothetical protein
MGMFGFCHDSYTHMIRGKQQKLGMAIYDNFLSFLCTAAFSDIDIFDDQYSPCNETGVESTKTC